MPRKHLIASGINKKQQNQAKIWLKCAKEIKAAAKLGTNPDSNYKLKAAIERALNNNLSRESIEKNINGANKNNEQLKELIYELYGPAGLSVIIKCLTNNENRTISNIRGYCSKYSFNIAKPNSVMINFNEYGIIIINKTIDEDSLLEKLLEFNIIELNYDDNEFEIIIDKKDFFNVKKYLQESNFVINFSEIKLIPNIMISLNETQNQQVEKFLIACEDDEDIQWVVTNKEL